MISRTNRFRAEEHDSFKTIQSILNQPTVTLAAAQKRYANVAVYYNDDVGCFCVLYDVEAGEELVPGFVAWTTVQDSVERPLRSRRLREARSEAVKLLRLRHKDLVALDDRA